MNKENTTYLIDNFSFFDSSSIKNGATSFVFECEDGWFCLIKNLCEKFEPYTLKVTALGED